MASKLVVNSKFGTFTRKTARIYTHIVIVKGYRAERIEASRLSEIASTEKALVNYRRTVEAGRSLNTAPGASGDWDRECAAKFLADGSYAEWIVRGEAELARLQAVGPITEDKEYWSTSPENLASTPQWSVLGWCGRLDLARKLYASNEASRYRNVAIIDVATGEEVRW